MPAQGATAWSLWSRSRRRAQPVADFVRLRIAEFLTAGALAGAVLGRRSRAVSALAGASLVAASAMTRFGIFEAGMASARDPKYTIVPQRRRPNFRGRR